MPIYIGKTKSPESVEKVTGADNTWMLKKTAEFMKLNADNTKQISQELDPAEYLNNPGFVQGTDPGTYINKKKDFIEKTAGDTNFLPPTTMASTMWETYMQATKQKELAGGIALEARTRVNARHQEVTLGVRMMNDTLAEYPTREKFNEMMENVESYVSTIDTEPGAEQYLPEGTANYMANRAKADLSNTYLKNAAKEDPSGVLDDIYNNTSYWKAQGLSEGDLISHAIQAREKATSLAVKDTSAIISMLKDNFQKIIDNGGDLSVSSLGSMNPDDFTRDEFVMKLGLLLPWYQRNLQDGATRTKDYESQLTMTVEQDGITYLVPTIRWNEDGTQMTEITEENAFDYAMEQGDALVVKDNAQGTRISNYMSRTLK